VFGVSEARADYTFNLGNLLVDDDPDAGNVFLSPTLPAGTYTSFQVSTNWTTATGFAYSDEAIWAFTNASTLTASTVFYADPGVSSNALTSTAPVTLNWSGNFDTPYTSGGLHFLTLQTYAGSSANWNNTTITLKNAPIVYPPPPSTNIGFPTGLGNSSSATGSLAASSVVWYNFVYGGGAFALNTFGSNLSNTGFGVNDTELGLFDAAGTIISLNDDFNTGFRESQIIVNQNTLTVGNTYYVALGSYDTTYTNGFGATSNATSTGTYRLNITVVPEAGSVALLGMGGFLGAVGIVTRRRKTA